MWHSRALNALSDLAERIARTCAGPGCHVSKAFRFHRYGGPEVLRFEDVDMGEPGPAEVRIRNTAVAVNFRDVLMRRGVHAVKSLPSGIGLESAGVIDAVGADVAGFSVGDASPMPACRKALTPNCASSRRRAVIPLPADIDERTAASMMIRGMTARCLLTETYKVQPGDTILIHAAAGGVGLIMCQWAKHLGATVIGTVEQRGEGGDRPRARLRSSDRLHARGFRRGACATSPAAKAFPSSTIRSARRRSRASLKCLRRRGVMASFGEASGDPDPMPPRRLGALGSIYLTHPSVSNYTVTRAELLAAAQRPVRHGGSGRIKIEISKTYPLRDAPRAHADIESRKTTGSIVLVV